MLTIKLRRILAETPNPTILEFGACDGRYTQAIVASIRQTPCLVYSFEPDPRNHAKFLKAKPPLVQFVPAAIGNVTGKVPFYLASPQPNGEIGSSSISPFKDQSTAFEWCKCEGTVEVDSWRLDDFADKEGLHWVDLIFMDIQGAERLMIEGATQTLQRTRYIWTEFEGLRKDCEGTCYQHSSSLERILELLPGWKAIETLPGDALLFNPGCLGNPHRPIDFIGV